MWLGPTSSRVALTALLAIAVAASCSAGDDDLGVSDPIDEPDAADPTASEPTPDPADTTETNGTTASTAGSTDTEPDATPATAPAAPTASDLVTPTTEKRPATATTPTGFADTVYERGLIDRGLAPFTSEAAADLAGRLGVSVDDVEVLTAVIVVWPDASIGCPEPGMSYAQVATDGSVIELGIGDRVYRYHSGGSRRPALCERPLTQPPEPTAIS
jgi:hypothetical protein